MKRVRAQGDLVPVKGRKRLYRSVGVDRDHNSDQEGSPKKKNSTSRELQELHSFNASVKM